MFVEFVVRIHSFLDAQMFHQHRRSARVLGKNHIYRPQNVDRPQGNVVEIAYRRRDYMEFGHPVGSVERCNILQKSSCQQIRNHSCTPTVGIPREIFGQKYQCAVDRVEFVELGNRPVVSLRIAIEQFVDEHEFVV